MYKTIYLIVFCLFVFVTPLVADPWGKDADLPNIKPKCLQAASKRQIYNPIAETLIRFHQNVISPADGPRSHFLPSSSQYTLDAIRKYGFFKGVIMGCDRLMRENSDPWVYPKVKNEAGKTLKWDPVK